MSDTPVIMVCGVCGWSISTDEDKLRTVHPRHCNQAMRRSATPLDPLHGHTEFHVLAEATLAAYDAGDHSREGVVDILAIGLRERAEWIRLQNIPGLAGKRAYRSDVDRHEQHQAMQDVNIGKGARSE